MISFKIRVAALLVLISFGILFFFILRHTNTDYEFDGSTRGEVRGEFTATGNITTYQTLRDLPFLLWVYDLTGNDTSFFKLRVWNISKIRIEDEYHGNVTYRNISMENMELTTDEQGAYFICNIKSGILKINYTSFTAFDNDGFFDMIYPYYSFHCYGELNHQAGKNLDFQLQSRMSLRVGNETVDIHVGRLAFPTDESARFEIIAKGKGLIKPTPTFIVNGSIQMKDFVELNAKGESIRRFARCNIISNEITISTVQEPYSDAISHERWAYVVPWVISIDARQYQYKIQ